MSRIVEIEGFDETDLSVLKFYNSDSKTAEIGSSLSLYWFLINRNLLSSKYVIPWMLAEVVWMIDLVNIYHRV